MSGPGPRASDALSPDMVEELSEAFRMFDTDGSGTITADELGAVIRTLGSNPTPGELEEIVRGADSDGNNQIDFSEFLEMMALKILNQDQEREIRDAFSVLSEGTEYVKLQVLGKVMEHLGEKMEPSALVKMLREADHDRDGKIGYDDFKRTMLAPGTLSNQGTRV